MTSVHPSFSSKDGTSVFFAAAEYVLVVVHVKAHLHFLVWNHDLADGGALSLHILAIDLIAIIINGVDFEVIVNSAAASQGLILLGMVLVLVSFNHLTHELHAQVAVYLRVVVENPI